MDEDQILQSIIADPDVVDPTIDVSQLRKTTETNPRLLGNVSGIEGLRFDPTRTDYIKDLYSVYSGGLPTIDVAQDTAQIPGAIDTLVDTGGRDGTNQVTGSGGTTPTNTGFEQNLIDQGIGVQGAIGDPVVAPGEIPVTQEEIDAFNAPALLDSTSTADEIMQDLTNQQAMLNPTGGNIMDEVALTDASPEQQNLVSQAFSKVGSTASDIMNDLSQIPGAIADFANQTIDIAGQKINVGATLLKAGINKIVGGPITLVFDALGATQSDPIDAATKQGLQEQGYQFDDIGRLTTGPMAGYAVESAFGDIAQATQERIDNIENRSAPQTEASIEKVGELYDFLGDVTQVKADTAAPQETDLVGDIYGTGTNIDPNIDVADGGADDPSRGNVSAPSGDVYGGAAYGYNEAAEKSDNGGSGGGGGKIVCTMMNESYGFGSFRNKIWLRHSKNLAPEYQKGYHKIFLPLVKLSKNNKVLKIMLEHIAVHRTIDIRQELRGKVHLLGRVYRKILEPICYLVGKYAK